MSFVTNTDISTYNSIIAGSISGLVTRFCIAPLDVIKIRLQLNPNDKLIATIYKIFRQESVFAFWKGNIPAEFLYLTYSSIQFTTFSTLNKHVPEGNFKHLIIGGVSGCTATLLSYPFDILRTKLISNESNKFYTLRYAFAEIYKVCLFNGGALSLLQVGLGTGLIFAFYKRFEDVPFGGLISGSLSKFLIYPLDLIKRNRQISNETIGQITKRIYQQRGYIGFYNGLLPTLIKSSPSTAISLYTYNYIINKLSP